MANQNTKPLQKTPLFDLIKEEKARMVPFAGWEMPVQFTGLKEEHETVRKAAGMFDVSHMGKFTLQGKNLLSHLQPLVPSDLERLQAGQAQYTVLLNEKGGIIDDVIIYYQGEDEQGEQRGIMIVNAATRSRDKALLQSHSEALPIRLEEFPKDQVLLAVQGPKAASLLQQWVETDLSKLKAFNHQTVSLMGYEVFMARTGYTGEDGFELLVNAEGGQELWKKLLAAGVMPCGLGCRDTLRLEAAMALYGQDIHEQTTPLEAGLGWLVHWKTKGEFKGRSKLEKQKKEGVSRKLVGIEMEGRYIARHGYPVVFEGEKVGEITSGTLSPTLKKAIALAYVPKALSKPGQAIEVEIRGKCYKGKVVKKPFYRSPSRAL